ncbi:MAG: tetratricopeptide repeat protein [Candidatus Schekmanbacteria bacterium]|nr:tetratricopeptide repeat protein [Candidatus Schekmanbacteria bacterium]
MSRKKNSRRNQKSEQISKTQLPRQEISTGLPVHLFWVIIIILLGIISYWPALTGDFVFDDGRSIVNNYALHIDSFSAANIERLKSLVHDNRTLSLISLALNYYFGRLNPWGYKLVNLIIHILTALSLYRLSLLTFRLPKLQGKYQTMARSIAILTALLFVVHPVNIQAVSYIVQRMTSLACLFFLLTLIFYLQGRQTAGDKRYLYWLPALFFALCALKSKENSATLPIIILIYELYFFESTPRPRFILWTLLLFPALIAYYYTRFDLSTVMYTQARHITYGQHLITQLRVIVYYLSLLIFPYPGRLNLDYDFPWSRHLFSPPTGFLSLLLVLGLIFLVFYLIKRNRLISFCLIWFLVNLAIESLLVLADTVFEHRLYLPGIGILWLLSLGLISATGRNKALSLVIASIVLLFAFWTYQRNLVWADPVRLWEDTVKKSPDKVRPHNNLANAYGSRGKYGQALLECRKALALDPDFAPVYHNLGLIYAQLGDRQKAVAAYQKAIDLDSGLLETQNNLATLYLKQGNYEKALIGFEFLAKQEPFSPVIQNNLGTVYQKWGQPQKALEYFQKALEIDPSFAEAQLNLGIAFAVQGKIEEALRQYQQTRLLLPNSAEVYYNLGQAYFILGKNKEAKEAYRQALKINAQMGQAYFGLGQLAALEKRYADAVKAYREAILLTPEWVEAYNELGNIYYLTDDYNEALEIYRQALKLDPNAANIYNNLGLVYAAMQQYEQAIQEHRRAQELDPESPVAYNHLGYIYLRQLKQPKEALKYFQTSLAVAPDQEDVEYLRKTVSDLEKVK